MVGLDKVIAMAHRLGVTADLQPNLSLPLGTSEIRPIDMASAYATFAAEGMYRKPYFVDQIEDRSGKVIFRHEDHPRRAISTETAREVIDVMKGTIASGTGTAARFPDRRPAAGKTGTTADYGDAWFVGYTRQLSTAVWVGSPIGRVEMRNVGGRRVTGGSYPALIWQAFMGPAHEGLPILDWEKPEFVGKGVALKVPGEKPTRRRVRPSTTTVPGTSPSTTPSETTPTTSDPEPTAPPDGKGPPGKKHTPDTEVSPSGQTEGGA